MPDQLFREEEIFQLVLVDGFLKLFVDVKQMVVAGTM